MSETKQHQLEVIEEIKNERGRQDAKWGGADHDDEHIFLDWQSFIVAKLFRARFEPDRRRELLIHVAAMALAAIESGDRKGWNNT